MATTGGNLDLVKTHIDNEIAEDIPAIAENFQKIDDGHTELKGRYEDHLDSQLPHKFSDGETDYRYGLAQEDDRLKFLYEEVV